ncbi:MAG: hypothetical protein ACXQTY_06330 [Candidatus Methanogasteraceae archaeon]
MSEIRKHDFLEKYTILARERTKRPTDFVKDSDCALIALTTTHSCEQFVTVDQLEVTIKKNPEAPVHGG